MGTDMVTIVVALIAAAASVASAFIAAHSGAVAKRREEEQQSYQEERMKQEFERQKMDEAVHQGIFAVLDAMDITLISLQGGHLNGNVEKAREEVEEARRDFIATRSKALSKFL